jgi:pimeloyl-ACP methyl ester carboxylesterase
MPSRAPLIVAHDLGGVGPPLFICHATGFCGGAYSPLAAELGERFRVWAVDLRGHGRAGSPGDGDFAYTSSASDLLWLIARLAGGRAHLVGHSMGGAVALLAARDGSELIAGVYAYEPAVLAADSDLGERNVVFANEIRRRREVFSSRSEALAAFAGKLPYRRLRADALACFVEHGLEDLSDGTVRLRCRAEVEASSYESNDVRAEDLADMGVPVTIACGGGDEFDAGLVPPPLARVLPDARLIVHEHLGHFGPLEAPHAIAQDILASFAATTNGTVDRVSRGVSGLAQVDRARLPDT